VIAMEPFFLYPGVNGKCIGRFEERELDIYNAGAA